MKATTKETKFNITATATPDELYTAAEIATSIALRTLHGNTGLQMYADLIRAYHNDMTARAAAEVNTRATTAAAMRDEARATAHQFAAIANRLTVTEEERAAALDEFAAWTVTANGHADEATDTAKALDGVTFSDRADLTQAAALAIIETWSNPAEVTESRRNNYAAAIGKDPDELTEEEENDLQTAANFRAAINAARRESTKLAHPDAMTATSTKSRAATPEEVKQWVDTMGGTGSDIRRAASRKNTKATDCFDTMEYKNTKRNPGWYIIRHYKTVRPYDSLEAAQEATGNGPIAPDAYADKEAAAEALKAIINAANLTAAERAALAYYMDSTATAAAEAARLDYLTQRAAAIAKLDERRQPEARARARATAANKATAARWTNALTRAGYKSERSRQRGQAAIIAALQGAAEHPTNTWYTESKPSRRPDLVEAISQAAAEIQTAPIIKWHNWEVLEAAAPCVTGWRTRAAKSARESAEAIRAAKHRSRVDNTTPEAKARAEAAARAYADKHRAAEEARAAEAKAKAEADHKAEVIGKAYKLDVVTLDTTFAMWQAWTDEQRAAHMAWLNVL